MVDAATATIYEQSPPEGPLRQGEILSGLKEPVAVSAPTEAEVVFDIVTHPFTIIISQACDLERDFEARQAGNVSGQLRSIHFCEALPDDLMRGQVAPGSANWKRIRENREERYMLLRAVPVELDAAGKGLPSLGIDFRRHFTLRPEVVYEQIAVSAQRRSVLRDLYATHLNSRFAFYISRVGLPVEHDSPLSDN